MRFWSQFLEQELLNYSSEMKHGNRFSCVPKKQGDVLPHYSIALF